MLRAGDSIGVFQLEGGPMRSLHALARADELRRRRRPRRPLPAGPDGGQHAPRLRRPQERPQAGQLPAPRSRADPRRHLRADDLPGVGDARRPALRRLHASRRRTTSARPAARRSARSIASRAREVRRRLRERGLRRASSAPKLFDIIEPFADYAFNKSHSYGYGLVAYQTAWLKANHPVEYLAALLVLGERRQGQDGGLPAECRSARHRGPRPRRQRSRRPTSPPGAERRRAAARSSSGSRRCATSARASSALIVAEREKNGPFVDFYDFCWRVDPSVLNKRSVESLVKAGAFDSLGHPRKGLCLVFEEIIDHVLDRRRERGARHLDALLAARATADGSRRRASFDEARRDDPRGRVRQGRAARVRKGDARPLRERPPAAWAIEAALRTPDGLHDRASCGDQAGASITGECHERRVTRRWGGHQPRRGATPTRRADGDIHLEDLEASIEVFVLPKDDAGVRRCASRDDADRRRPGTPRRSRGRGQAGLHGDHPPRARRPTDRARRSRSRCRSPR